MNFIPVKITIDFFGKSSLGDKNSTPKSYFLNCSYLLIYEL